jgi:hypothetical protein
MLQAIAGRQLATARAALQEGKTLHEQLVALILAFIRLATEDAGGFHVSMSALYGVNRAFQEEALGLLREYIALIRGTLEDTLPSEARGRVDLEPAALLVLSATESLILSARVLGYSERRLAEMAPLIAEFLLSGLSDPARLHHPPQTSEDGLKRPSP